MVKQNNFPSAMNDIGLPVEMSPIQDVTNTEYKSPIVEVGQPFESKELKEIRTPSSVTVI